MTEITEKLCPERRYRKTEKMTENRKARIMNNSSQNNTNSPEKSEKVRRPVLDSDTRGFTREEYSKEGDFHG
jgi:hypothetical protein